jgi:prepilin-type N-terminal cleavage/methylation domain-containing protein
MNAQRRQLTRMRSTSKAFSLMELMIVVVITGVLAAIAIPTFSGYVQKSRTSEATQFLGAIKLRQESYRAEFGQYAQYNNNANPLAIVFVPDVAAKNPHSASVPGSVFLGDQYFNIIGAKSDGPVRFGYGWAAGLPQVAAANVGVAPYDAPADHYFVAQARGDLNDDGVYCNFELTSFTSGVWFSPARGWD